MLRGLQESFDSSVAEISEDVGSSPTASSDTMILSSHSNTPSNGSVSWSAHFEIATFSKHLGLPELNVNSLYRKSATGRIQKSERTILKHPTPAVVTICGSFILDHTTLLGISAP